MTYLYIPGARTRTEACQNFNLQRTKERFNQIVRLGYYEVSPYGMARASRAGVEVASAERVVGICWRGLTGEVEQLAFADMTVYDLAGVHHERETH